MLKRGRILFKAPMLIVVVKDYLYSWGLYEKCLKGTEADWCSFQPSDGIVFLKLQAQLRVLSKHRELLLVLIQRCPRYWEESLLSTFLSPLRQKYDKSVLSKVTSTSKSVSFRDTFSEVRLETPQKLVSTLYWIVTVAGVLCCNYVEWSVWFETVVCWLLILALIGWCDCFVSGPTCCSPDFHTCQREKLGYGKLHWRMSLLGDYPLVFDWLLSPWCSSLYQPSHSL